MWLLYYPHAMGQRRDCPLPLWRRSAASENFSATITVESLPSSLLAYVETVAICTRTTAVHPSLATLEKRRVLEVEASEIAGVEGGGETRTAGHWLEARPCSLGMLDLESKLPRNPGNYALEWAQSTRRTRWADGESQ